MASKKQIPESDLKEGKSKDELSSQMKAKEIEKSALKKILDHLEKDLKKRNDELP